MRAKFVNETFKEESEPIDDMQIGQIAEDRRKVRASSWTATSSFLDKILSQDFGYKEYMGYKILIYYAGNNWWAITSRDHKGAILKSRGGASSLTKESALRDIQRMIRSAVRKKQAAQKVLNGL
jgi:hypothetical protein